MTTAQALAPLRDRRFRLLFAGRAVSMLGSSMAPVALAFAVLDLSDSAAVLGIVLAARSIPMAAFMLVGGVVADRFSRSVVLRVSHLLSAATQGAVAAAAASPGTPRSGPWCCWRRPTARSPRSPSPR